jgi:hypothetical protein
MTALGPGSVAADCGCFIIQAQITLADALALAALPEAFPAPHGYCGGCGGCGGGGGCGCDCDMQAMR